MLVPLAGMSYIGFNFGTIPLPINLIKDCEQTFFINNGLTNDEMEKRISLFTQSVENISKSNTFFIEILRQKPELGGLFSGTAVAGFLSMFATEVEINMPYYGTESVNAGTKSIKHFMKKESGDISVTFMNPSENLARAYFLKDKDGENVTPDDGTALLPTEYYFKIQMWKWVVREGIRAKSFYIDDYFHVNSNIGINFDSNSEELQTFSVAFTKMSTGGILE